MFSASDGDRVMRCPASAVLQRNGEITYANVGGNVLAEFLAALDTVSRDEALAAAPEEDRPFLALVDVDALPAKPGTFAAEVAFAMRLDEGTAAEVGRKIGRDYSGAIQRTLGRPRHDLEIVGTADVVAMAADAVVVLDHKRGHALHVPRARDTWQLRILALMASRAYGVSRAVVGIIRVLPDGTPRYDMAELDALDLDCIEHELGELATRIAVARKQVADWVVGFEPPTVTIGSHCRYCPAIDGCPRYRSLFSLVAHQTEETAEKWLPMAHAELATDDQLATLYDRVKLAKKFLSRVEAALYTRAAQRPIALHNGKFLAEVIGPGKPRYDGAKVHALLEEKHGRAVADAAVTMETSGAGIERAIKPMCTKRGTLKPAMAEIMAAVESAGAVTRPPSRSVEEVEERRLALAVQLMEGPGPSEAEAAQ